MNCDNECQKGKIIKTLIVLEAVHRISRGGL